MDKRAIERLASEIALREAAVASLEAISALAATLSPADAVALAAALDSRSGIELRTTISRSAASTFELAIRGALGRRRVLASCSATQDLPTTKEAS